MISPDTMQRLKTKVQNKVTATTPGTWGKVGVGMLVGGAAIGWLAFPFVLDKVVASQINLAEGKDSRKLWIQLPTFDFNIYLFNFTNPAEVMRGAKPAVQQIGPYCYKEFKDKTDFVEDPTADTISYSARSTWHENQKSPSCEAPQLTGEELLVVPNVPMLAILLIAEKDFPIPFMTLINQALPNIFGKFNDLFMTVTARKLMFDGIPINCKAIDLLPRAVCIALKQNSRALKKIGRNQYSFSYFGAKNNTVEEFRYTVSRGTQDGQAIGRLEAFDGKPELPFWRGECNKLQGTDGSVFPPFRKMENGSLTAYSSEVCRIFYGIYEGKVDYKGVLGYGYSISLGNPEANLGERCYCVADDRCKKKGVLDLQKCQGAPLFASHAHFYGGSPDYRYGVEGLSPDKDKHGILVVLEPISGTPLIVRKRIQFNIEMKPFRYVTVSQGLRRTMVPLFWAEEKLDLDTELMGLLEGSLFRPIRAVDVIKWFCVATGVSLGVTAAVLKYRKNKRDKVHILNEDAACEFDQDPDPKAFLKHMEVGEINVIDPLFIHTKEPTIQTNENGNVLSAATLMKSASTMTSANRFKLTEFRNSGVPTDENPSAFTLPGSTVPALSSHSHELSIGNAAETSPAMEVMNSTMTVPIIPIEIMIQPTNHDITSVDSPKIRLAKSSAKPIYSNPLDYQHSKSPKNFSSSIEHQMSKITSISSNFSVSNNLPAFTNVPNPQIPVENNGSSSSFDVSENIERRLNAYSNTSKKNSPVTSGNGKPQPISFDEAELFGETMSRWSNEKISSAGRESVNINTENEVVEHTFNNDLTDGQTDQQSNNTNQPTKEELKIVEEEIQKLMAEMAELLPRKLNRTESGSM